MNKQPLALTDQLIRQQEEIEELTKERDEQRTRAEAAEACCAEIRSIVAMLIEVARAAWCLADNTAAHVEVGNHVTHIIEADDFDRLSKALDVLDELPDPPNEVSTGPRKAEHALSTSCGQPLLARVKRLEEASNNLKEFCETNPANVRDIPDDVWVPFCNALNETEAK